MVVTNHLLTGMILQVLGEGAPLQMKKKKLCSGSVIPLHKLVVVASCGNSNLAKRGIVYQFIFFGHKLAACVLLAKKGTYKYKSQKIHDTVCKYKTHNKKYINKTSQGYGQPTPLMCSHWTHDSQASLSHLPRLREGALDIFPNFLQQFLIHLHRGKPRAG